MEVLQFLKEKSQVRHSKYDEDAEQFKILQKSRQRETGFKILAIDIDMLSEWEKPIIK